MNIVKKGILTATLAATALVTTSPALARDYRGNGDNTAAIAIGVGVVGLALGALIASSDNDRGRDRYDDRYHVRDGWYYDGGQYYNRQGNRYDRNEWNRRYGNERDGRRGNDRNWRNNDNRYDYGQDRDYYQRRGY